MNICYNIALITNKWVITLRILMTMVLSKSLSFTSLSWSIDWTEVDMMFS